MSLPLPGALDNSGFNGTGELDLSRNGQVSYTRVWGPRWSRDPRQIHPAGDLSRWSEPGMDLFKQFGIGGYNPTIAYTDNGGLPNKSHGSGYTGFGARRWDLQWNTTTSGTWCKMSRSAKAPTP